MTDTKLPAFLDRLAFLFLILLALTFAFEIPLRGKVGDADLTNVKILEVLLIGCWIVSQLAARKLPHFPKVLVLPVLLWLAALTISTLLAPRFAGPHYPLHEPDSPGLATGLDRL